MQQYYADKTVVAPMPSGRPQCAPPHSPDLNLLDYSVWWEVEWVACAAPHSSVDALKALVTSVWNALDADYVRATCTRFRPCIELMIARDGGYSSPVTSINGVLVMILDEVAMGKFMICTLCVGNDLS